MPRKSSKVNSSRAADSPKWEYQCIYCKQTFLSGRALGGHQNAHRFEAREKRRTHHLRVPMRDRDRDRDRTVDGSSSGPMSTTVHPPAVPSNHHHHHVNVQPAPSVPPNWSTTTGYANLSTSGRLPVPPPLAAHDMQHVINVPQDHPWNIGHLIGQAAATHHLDISSSATAFEDGVEVTSKMRRVDLEVDLELKL